MPKTGVTCRAQKLREALHQVHLTLTCVPSPRLKLALWSAPSVFAPSKACKPAGASMQLACAAALRNLEHQN